MSALERVPQIQQPMATESLPAGNIDTAAPPMQGGGGALTPGAVLPDPNMQSGHMPASQGALAPDAMTPEGGNQGYNGTVIAFGKPVEVVNGVADIVGDAYFVSEDGSVVMDQERNIVGSVQNGEFVVIDEDYLRQLQEDGLEIEQE